jgi:hypothetical protein
MIWIEKGNRVEIKEPKQSGRIVVCSRRELHKENPRQTPPPEH